MALDQRRVTLPWPDWQIVKELGHGSYGVVYQAERGISGVKEEAAIKVVSFPQNQEEIESGLLEGYDMDSLRSRYMKQRQAYANEYNLMMSLKGQTNIVNCDDFAAVPHDDGIGWDIYIRMELLTPLTQVMRRRKLSEEEIVSVGKDICRALMLCESIHIIHRDIKPDNIMVSKFGDYKLGDFGIARTMDHTTAATMIGTERYMAPEVIRGEKYGPEVDIYSLGLVLYWMLNNRKIPFIDADTLPDNDELAAAQAKRVRGDPLPPPAFGNEVLKRIVLKACAFRPEDRYSSAREMYTALDHIRDVPETAGASQTDKNKAPVSFDSRDGSYGQTLQASDIDMTAAAAAGRSSSLIGISAGTSGNGSQSKKRKHLPVVIAAICGAAVIFIALSASGILKFTGTAGGTSPAASVETVQTDDKAELVLASNVILKGDQIDLQYKGSDGKQLSYADGLSFSSSDTSVATVAYDESLNKMILTGAGEGTATITGTLNGVSAGAEIIVASVDEDYGARMDSSTVAVVLKGGNNVRLSFDMSGNLPDHLLANIYNTPGLDLDYSGGFDGNELAINVSDNSSSDNSGNITVLISDNDDPGHIIAGKVVKVTIGG